MRKILLVEDEDILRETYKAILSTLPYAYDVAENGHLALEKCEHERYDLILLDLMMPVMDGVTFLEHFIPDKPAQTKVVVISNLSSGKELERAIQLGAHKTIVKAHYSPGQLRTLITDELQPAGTASSFVNSTSA
jgi:CheY-like chemotaxis protein